MSLIAHWIEHFQLCIHFQIKNRNKQKMCPEVILHVSSYVQQALIGLVHFL